MCGQPSDRGRLKNRRCGTKMQDHADKTEVAVRECGINCRIVRPRELVKHYCL